MFCVFWVSGWETEDEYPCGKVCPDFDDAIATADKVRKSGGKFVTIGSEIPGNVTKMGSAVATEYEWKKRR